MLHFTKPHFSQQHLVNKITFKTHHETTLGRCGEVSKSKTLYANSSKMIVVIIFGLLSARRYHQYDHSNAVLILLLCAIWLKRMKKFRQHGITLLAAVVLHTVTILA